MDDASIPTMTPEEREVRLVDLLAVWYRKYVERNFERAFVVLTLLAVIVIGYLMDNKLAFINFFYIPVFFAAYGINSRVAVLGSVFSVLVVSLYAILAPDRFIAVPSQWNLFFHLMAWGSFLILTGAVVGRLNEKLSDRYRRARSLVTELQDKQVQLERLQKDLLESNATLNAKNRAIEGLKEKLEAVLYSTMDPEVAKLVVNRQIVTEKKLVTILFADLQGFTPFSEGRPPELVIEELNKYFNTVEPIVARFRGHLDKYIGDGLMVEFGTPLHYQHHSLLALLAAMQFQERVTDARFPLKMRIGIATGAAIVGLVGSDRRKSYSAFGDTVNLAQRLEMLCPAGSLLIDEATHHKVSHFVNTRKVRMGMDDGESRKLEASLAELERELKAGGTNAAQWLKGGRIASQLGELSTAISCFKEALKLVPDKRDEIEKAIAQAVLLEEELSYVEVKGRRLRVAAYEVLGLADPLRDPNKFPGGFYAKYSGLDPRVKVAPEVMLSIEALDGSVGHSRSTALLSYAVAEAMDADGELKETVLAAGTLHHVGKRHIPEHLLNREDADFDLQVVTGHVDEAEKVISEMGLEVSEKVLEAVRHHHEAFTGGGYPSGLKGDAIPLSSRILQAASQYVTLTSWKSYRDAWDQKAALNELRREAELGRYDPNVVKSLYQALDAS